MRSVLTLLKQSVKVDTSEPNKFGTANQWIGNNFWQVYVRLGWRTIVANSPYMLPTIEIANIAVKEPGRGYFTRQLRRIEKWAIEYHRVLYIENVLDARFQLFFLNRGYLLSHTSTDSSMIFYYPLSLEKLPDWAKRDVWVNKAPDQIGVPIKKQFTSKA